MRVCYILLSPTPGMHRYTADLAHLVAGAGHEVHLVTTMHAPREVYGPEVATHTPMATTGAGAALEALRSRTLRDLRSMTDWIVHELRPDVAHLTGPHPSNLPLLRALRRRGIPVVHSLHTLDPDRGLAYNVALRLWNRQVVRSADHVLVHGPAYRERLLGMGLPPERVTWTPLLRLFLGETLLEAGADPEQPVTYEPWALYLGSLEQRDGLEHLITACAMMNGGAADGGAALCSAMRMVLAGKGDVSRVWAGPLPEGLEVRHCLVGDWEAADLLARCGVLVLPRADWSEPALCAAAYYYHKPAIVTRFHAVPECVEEGCTGYVVEPGHAATLARRLDELLGDPERLAQMGAAGRAWYDAHRAQEERTLVEMYARLAA